MRPLLLLALLALAGCSDDEPVTFRVLKSVESDRGCWVYGASVHNGAVHRGRDRNCLDRGDSTSFTVDPRIYGSSRDTVRVVREETLYVYHPSWDAALRGIGLLAFSLVLLHFGGRWLDQRAEKIRRAEDRADRMASEL